MTGVILRPAMRWKPRSGSVELVTAVAAVMVVPELCGRHLLVDDNSAAVRGVREDRCDIWFAVPEPPPDVMDLAATCSGSSPRERMRALHHRRMKRTSRRARARPATPPTTPPTTWGVLAIGPPPLFEEEVEVALAFGEVGDAAPPAAEGLAAPAPLPAVPRTAVLGS